jgi:hypothetical protein
MAKLSESNGSKIGFILLGCVSIGSLFGSFAGNLESFEVWQQKENNQFGQEYSKIFILTENDPKLPYGINKKKAEKIAANYDNLKLQKFFLLGVSIISSSFALLIGESKLLEFEIETEAKKINAKAEKEYRIKQINQKWAMASEAQRQLYLAELRELVALCEGDQTQDASEINETDKFINANYLLAEGHNIDVVVAQTWGYKAGTPEHEEMKSKFLEWSEQ